MDEVDVQGCRDTPQVLVVPSVNGDERGALWALPRIPTSSRSRRRPGSPLPPADRACTQGLLAEVTLGGGNATCRTCSRPTAVQGHVAASWTLRAHDLTPHPAYLFDGRDRLRLGGGRGWPGHRREHHGDVEWPSDGVAMEIWEHASTSNHDNP